MHIRPIQRRRSYSPRRCSRWLRVLAVLLSLGLLCGGFSQATRMWLEQEEGAVLVDSKKHKPREAVPQRSARRLGHTWQVVSGIGVPWEMPISSASRAAALLVCVAVGQVRAGSGVPLRC
jgi:hypothetical protein